jgi:hypothetical protein
VGLRSGVHYANWKRRIEKYDELGNRIDTNR